MDVASHLLFHIMLLSVYCSCVCIWMYACVHMYVSHACVWGGQVHMCMHAWVWRLEDDFRCHASRVFFTLLWGTRFTQADLEVSFMDPVSFSPTLVLQMCPVAGSPYKGLVGVGKTQVPRLVQWVISKLISFVWRGLMDCHISWIPLRRYALSC